MAQEANQTDLEKFIAQCCEETPDRHTLFTEFYGRFQQWPGGTETHAWSKKQVSSELPIRHQTAYGTGHKVYVSNLTLKPAEKEKP